VCRVCVCVLCERLDRTMVLMCLVSCSACRFMRTANEMFFRHMIYRPTYSPWSFGRSRTCARDRTEVGQTSPRAKKKQQSSATSSKFWRSAVYLRETGDAVLEVVRTARRLRHEERHGRPLLAFVFGGHPQATKEGTVPVSAQAPVRGSGCGEGDVRGQHVLGQEGVVR
jgi:hypothetical protein